MKGQREGNSLGNVIKTLPIYICALGPCKKSQLITYRISLKEIFKVSNFSSTPSRVPDPVSFGSSALLKTPRHWP